MSNPYKALLATFEFNIFLAQSLIPLQPKENHDVILKWLRRLAEKPESADVMNIHAEYTWYLLLNLQDLCCLPPFNLPPPISELEPLATLVPPELYKYIMESVEAELGLEEKWKKCQETEEEEETEEEKKKRKERAEEDKSSTSTEVSDETPDNLEKKISSSKKKIKKKDKSSMFFDEEQNRLRCPPAIFYQLQPKPKNGAYCYACVFSDHRE